MTNTTRISVEDWSEEQWLQYRWDHGWGSSDMGAVCDAEGAHGSSLDKYLEKIGEKPSFQGNVSSNFGKLHEDTIRDLYQYWDWERPGAEAMWENKNGGILLREARKDLCFVQHNEYPIFYSPDGECQDLGLNVVVECKNTTKMNIRSYLNNLPVDFFFQIQNSLLIGGYDVAHLAMQLDGNDFEVIEIHPDPETQEFIVYRAIKLWMDVLKGRQIKEKYGIDSYYNHHIDYFDEWQQEGVRELQALEPETNPASNDLSFVREMIKAKEDLVSMEATPEQREMLKLSIGSARTEADHKKLKEYANNWLIQSMGEEYNKITVEDLGHFTYRRGKDGKGRALASNSLKKAHEEGRF